MATMEDLERALDWANAQVGKPYSLGTFGDSFDCSTFMSGIATMIRDGKPSRWFTTHPFHGGAQNPLPGWEKNLEAPFMIGITDEGIGHTGGTLAGLEFEATPPRVRSGEAARGARDPMFKWVYGFRPSIVEGTSVEYTKITLAATDTLASLASKYKTTVDNLVSINNLIPVGMSLVVVDPTVPPVDPPTKVPVLHTATYTDSFTSIAAQYKITVDQLLEWNGIKVASGSKYIVGYKADEPVPDDPYINGLPKMNSTDPSAKPLQAELKRVGYMSKDVEPADNYGPKTQDAVAAFHNDKVQFRRPNLTYDAQINQAGWVFLRGMADGSGKIVQTPSTNTVGQISPNQVLFTKSGLPAGKATCEAAIKEALTIIGLPVTQDWINGYLTIALRESSYNPNAVNTYDSNAINPPGYSTASDGNPFQCSRGAWQCIPQTFARYHQAGTSLSIYDPVASAAASINYVRSRYGVLNDGSNLASKVQQADPSRPPRGY